MSRKLNLAELDSAAINDFARTVFFVYSVLILIRLITILLYAIIEVVQYVSCRIELSIT